MTGHLLLLAAPRKGIDLILPDKAELIWGAICFAVVAFLLMKFAFPRIRETIEDAERAIQGSHEEAERRVTMRKPFSMTTRSSWPRPARNPTASSKRGVSRPSRFERI